MNLPKSRRIRWSAVIAVSLAVFLGGSYVFQGAKRDAAQQTAQSLAAPLSAICADDPAAAARAAAPCPTADAVARDPSSAAALAAPSPAPAAGRDGKDAAPARGITGTSTAGGTLVITYSDGTSTNLGPVVGPGGAAGAAGGAGKEGADGAAGRGIASTSLVDGRLVVLFTDGARVDLGPVVGPAGRGIASADGSTGRLLLTLTDGVVLDAGPLPPGPAGQDAPPVERQTFYLDDGSTRDCVRSGGSASAPEFRCAVTPATTAPAPPPVPETEGGS